MERIYPNRKHSFSTCVGALLVRRSHTPKRICPQFRSFQLSSAQFLLLVPLPGRCSSVFPHHLPQEATLRYLLAKECCAGAGKLGFSMLLGGYNIKITTRLQYFNTCNIVYLELAACLCECEQIYIHIMLVSI